MGWWANIVGGNGRRNGSPYLEELGLLSYRLFQRELQRQRAQCDRAGGRFVLVVLGVVSTESKNPDPKVLTELASIVSRRVRLSDVAGAHGEDGSRLGVILADTDHDGAQQFLVAFEETMRAKMNGSWRADYRLRCELFPYPEQLAAVMITEKGMDSSPSMKRN